MKHLIRTTVFAALLLTSGSAFATQISIGIQIGPPPRPRMMRVQPRRPNANAVFIQGYWYPVGRRYAWHEGYWTLPPYPGARWIDSRYEGRRFYEGYWDGNGGRFDHDHRWDGDQDRDGGRDQNQRPGRGNNRNNGNNGNGNGNGNNGNDRGRGRGQNR